MNALEILKYLSETYSDDFDTLTWSIRYNENFGERQYMLVLMYHNEVECGVTLPEGRSQEEVDEIGRALMGTILGQAIDNLNDIASMLNITLPTI